MIHVLTMVMTFVTLLADGPKNSEELKNATGLQEPLTLNEEWKTLHESNYSVDYPSTWELNQTKGMGTSFILFARGEAEGKFRENVNLMIQDLTGMGIDLNKYVEVSEQQIRTMLANAKIIGSKRIKTAAGEYHEIMYAGDQGAYHLQWKQYYWVQGEKAYVLTYTATQATYDQYFPTADKVLNSFKIKKG
jgi:hypothetical protein